MGQMWLWSLLMPPREFDAPASKYFSLGSNRGRIRVMGSCCWSNQILGWSRFVYSVSNYRIECVVWMVKRVDVSWIVCIQQMEGCGSSINDWCWWWLIRVRVRWNGRAMIMKNFNLVPWKAQIKIVTTKKLSIGHWMSKMSLSFPSVLCRRWVWSMFLLILSSVLFTSFTKGTSCNCWLWTNSHDS